MNILVLTTSYPENEKDFSGIFIKNFISELPQQVQVTVCTPQKNQTHRDEIDGHIRVRRYHYWLPFNKEILMQEGGIVSNLKKSFAAKIQLIPFVFFSVLYAIKYSKNQDIIHAHWVLGAIQARILHFLKKTPYILTVHGTDAEIMKNSILVRTIMKGILLKASKVICVSSFLKKEVSRISPNANVCVYPNGVGGVEKLFHITRNPVSKNPAKFLYVGRLSEEKNILWLINGFRLIKKTFNGIHLSIVGSGSLENKIKNFIKKSNLENNIDLIGPVPPHEISKCYQNADIFILPSLREGFGVVLIEAMAAGLPVIASNVGGITDIIEDAKSGLFIDPKDVKTLEAAVNALYLDSNKRYEMGVRGRRLVEKKYMWKNIALNIYNNIYLKTSG